MKIRDKIKNDFNRLEDVRKSAGWTQAKMAEKIGVTRVTYSDWVTGKKIPSIESWDKIKEYLEG